MPCAEPFTNRQLTPLWKQRSHLHQLGHKAVIKRSRAPQSLQENIYFLQLPWVMATGNNGFGLCLRLDKNQRQQKDSAFVLGSPRKPTAWVTQLETHRVP